MAPRRRSCRARVVRMLPAWPLHAEWGQDSACPRGQCLIRSLLNGFLSRFWIANKPKLPETCQVLCTQLRWCASANLPPPVRVKTTSLANTSGLGKKFELFRLQRAKSRDSVSGQEPGQCLSLHTTPPKSKGVWTPNAGCTLSQGSINALSLPAR